MLKTTNGQGALEYLLLIGGAVIVSAIVVVLVLNLGGTNQSRSDSATMSSICTKFAASAGNATPICNDVSTHPAVPTTARIWNNTTNSCWICTGTYPNCVADKETATTDGACGSGTNQNTNGTST